MMELRIVNNLNDPQSRRDRHKRQKENRVLNVLIAVVVIAIVIVAFIVIPGGKEQSENKGEKNQNEEIIQKDQEIQKQVDPEEQDDEQDENPEIDATEEEDHEPIITEETDDPIVIQSIVNPTWAPIQTAQVGEHVSMYDGVSVDWQEKVAALTYATGLPEEGMTIWRLKNGGSPKKSIGIVSSKDTVEKYRVYLEWIDTEGWKPVKMDVLNTLDFNY